MQPFTLPSGVAVRPQGAGWVIEYDHPVTLSPLQAERLAKTTRASA